MYLNNSKNYYCILHSPNITTNILSSVSFFQVKNSSRLYPHDLKKGKREREKMAKNRTHEEVTESDSSSEFHGTCVKFRFYEDGGAGRERR